MPVLKETAHQLNEDWAGRKRWEKEAALVVPGGGKITLGARRTLLKKRNTEERMESI